MGRLRIKKKEAVLPFRDTVAYRMLLFTASVIIFFFALYQTISAFRNSNMNAGIIAAALTIAAGVAVYFNVGLLSQAKIPPKTLQRMKRR